MTDSRAPMQTPDTVEARLLLTIAQARVFAKFMAGGAAIAATWQATGSGERAELEVAIWAIGRQLKAQGITTGEDEGQGRA